MALASPYDNEVGRSTLYGEVLDKYHSGLRVRAVREPEWYLAKEFFKGNQYNVWLDGRGIVAPPMEARRQKKARLIYNKIRVTAETILSYLLKGQPTFIVAPMTGEDDDQAAALCARRVLYSYYRQLLLAEKLEVTGLWSIICGIGGWRIGWNPLAGPKIPLMGQVQMPGPMDEMGNELSPGPMAQVPIGQTPGGDVRVDVVSPFEIIPDEGADDISNAEYIIHHTMFPVDEGRRLYPAAAKFINAERPEQQGFAQRALQAWGLLGRGASSQSRLARFMRIEYWARPSSKYPDGLRVVATRDGILEAGPTPPGFDHLPFAFWKDRVVPGEWYPDSTIKDAIPLQKELNKRVSQSVDIANRFKTKWVAMDGSIDEKQVNDEDGEVILYTGRPPEAVTPPPFPDSIAKLIELTNQAIDDTTGAIPVLQGRSEGEERSGRQVAYRGQYGETRISRLATHLAAFLTRAGTLILRQVAANVTDERLGRLNGKNRQVESFYFKGADLKDCTDVSVEVGSLMGFTNAERFDKLMRLNQQGIVGPDKVLDGLEIEDLYPLLDELAADRNNALQENEGWRTSQNVPPPRDFENHVEHLRIHNHFRKGADYRQSKPELQGFVDGHCKLHEQFIQMAQMAQMAMQAPPGSPPGGPEPKMPPGGPPDESGAKESGAETAQGLPSVPAVPSTGPEQPSGG